MTPDPQLSLLLPTDPLPLSLLLLADEAMEAIEKYIYKSDVYVLQNTDGHAIGAFALYHNNPEELEIKNIAVDPQQQGMGLGTYMLEKIQAIAATSRYQRIIVGTATVGRQLDFYKKNGFLAFGLRKNFFLEHYPEPIFEGDQQLVDMVLLEKKL